MRTAITAIGSLREIIGQGVWLYHRFCLSFRDVEEFLAKRGFIVSYEAIRQWCRKSGPEYARKLRRRRDRLGDVWHQRQILTSRLVSFQGVTSGRGNHGCSSTRMASRSANADAHRTTFRRSFSARECYRRLRWMERESGMPARHQYLEHGKVSE